MRNCPVARNWRQYTLRNRRFASNRPVLLKAKAGEKRRAQLSCCSKLAPNHTAQLSFCLKWPIFLKKLKLVQDTVRNRAVTRNWPLVRLRNCRFASDWVALLGS